MTKHTFETRYTTEEIGDFGGNCVEIFYQNFNSLEDALDYIKSFKEKTSHYRRPEEYTINLLDNVKIATNEIQALETKIQELKNFLLTMKN